MLSLLLPCYQQLQLFSAIETSDETLSLDGCLLTFSISLLRIDPYQTCCLYSPFLSSGVAGLWGSFTLPIGAGEEVRCSILAGVLALLGRALGVDGLPRVDGGLGEAAGLGEAVLPFGVAGDDGRCLDKGLGLKKKRENIPDAVMHLDKGQGWSVCLKMTHVLKKPDFFKQVQSRHSTQMLRQPYSALSESRFTSNATLKRRNIHYAEDNVFFFYILWHWWHWQLAAKLFVAFLLSQKNFLLLFHPFCHLF